MMILLCKSEANGPSVCRDRTLLPVVIINSLFDAYLHGQYNKLVRHWQCPGPRHAVVPISFDEFASCKCALLAIYNVTSCCRRIGLF